MRAEVGRSGSCESRMESCGTHRRSIRAWSGGKTKAPPALENATTSCGFAIFVAAALEHRPRYAGTVYARLARLALLVTFIATGCRTASAPFDMTYDTPTDPRLQERLGAIDAELRTRFGMTLEQTAAGILDLNGRRLAMLHPDRIEYAASVAKIGILLAWFTKHPEAAKDLDAQTQHELGLMIKASNNEMATKFSRQLGLREIQQVLNDDGFYDASRGGGIWMGKHYGANSERIGDPVANHSHAATVRQLLRFYFLLDERRLVSRAASEKMIEIFRSPDIPHDDLKFVKGLAGRDVTLLRKWGSYEDYLHDTAIIEGPGRRYVLVALTHHPSGDAYLEALARAVDDVMSGH
jgi:beta-lactamase class A